MIKRTIIGILISFFVTAGSVRAQWNSEACPTKEDLNAVCFINTGQGWAVGDNGTILTKINDTWIKCLSPVKEDLFALAMISKDDGWAAGADGTIIRFNGLAWEKTESPTGNDRCAGSFKDSENGVITGENGTVLMYKGKIWNKLDKNIRANLYTTQFLKDDIFLGGGMELLNVPIMKISVNLANSLTSLFDSNIAVTGIVFTRPDNAWIIGSPGALIHYDGENWTKPELEYRFPSLNNISFSDDNNGICVGYSGTILTFAGNGWIREEPVTNMHLNGSAIFSNRYYAVGDRGTILVKDFKKESTDPKQSELSEGIFGLYPNPCSDFLNIDLNGLSDDSSGTVSIMDLKGEVLDQKQINGSKGNIHLTFETSGFKSGIYLVKVMTGSKILLRKFIVN